MNILMLTDVYFPRVNGVSTSIRTFTSELTKQGHSVTIVAPDYGVAATTSEFEIIRLPSRKIFFDPEDRLIRRSAVSTALAALAKRQWDVVHIHTPFRAHQIGVRLGRAIGRATIESYHTFFEEYASHYLPWVPGVLLRFFTRRLSHRLCDGVRHLIVPSTQMAEVLIRYGITTPYSVIPTGIELDEFRGGNRDLFRTDHAICAGRPTLVTVSRLAAEKNIAFLIDVVWILVEDFPDILFVIAGEGPDANRLKQKIVDLHLVDNVLFVGNLERRTALLDCYKAGDIFVFASPTETQGLVLVEAMALGVPIVSTAVMGTATVLEGTLSALVSTQDAKLFAQVVTKLLRSPEALARLAANGPKEALRWSVRELIKPVIELYEQVRLL